MTAPAPATPDELMDAVYALSDLDAKAALAWLGTAGAAHPDGQALLRALGYLHRRDRRRGS